VLIRVSVLGAVAWILWWAVNFRELLPPVLIGLTLVALLAYLNNWERREPAPSQSGPVIPAFCAWCKWRKGEDCTHPESPVSGRTCGPVCAGEVKQATSGARLDSRPGAPSNCCFSKCLGGAVGPESRVGCGLDQ